MSDLRDLRLTYARAELRRSDLSPDPVQQFQRWLDEALQDGLREPYAMSLATAAAPSSSGLSRPSVRTVLLRGLEGGALSFFTNYASHKGLDLAGNPQAEVLFFWAEHERQVRAYGDIERLPDQQSEAYFHSRPHDSQLAAHVSDPQSAPVDSREALEAKLAALRERYPAGSVVPRPDFWGGYRLQVQEWEFWQGRPSRVHDRFRYAVSGGGWQIERLMP
ncbi:pyridoxamine 5'-phosphate oxidase [Deinococcus hohokamensis]|uniref:Pyridoxine/pyridoxamine 5'-phosphate oxidase n=1 Tax=Deinococcus hohokamensis TaxID=309883 RepID=A0ABV9IBR6_9DEIO